jgi:hypothetical protein
MWLPEISLDEEFSLFDNAAYCALSIVADGFMASRRTNMGNFKS